MRSGVTGRAGRTTVPSAEVCALIDDVLVPRMDEIAEQITREIHRHDAAPGADPEAVAETRASCRANLRVTLAMWRAGQDPRGAHPTEAGAAYARAYARSGRPLADLLRVYRIGQEELMSILRHEVAERLPPETALRAVEEASSFIFNWIDATLEELEAVYHREREASERTSAATRRRVAAAILAGEDPDLVEAGAALRYDLRRRHLGAVIWSDAGADVEHLEEAARTLASRWTTEAPLTLPIGGLALGVWVGAWEAPTADDAPEHALPDDVRCALGTWRGGLEGFRATHHEALRARRAATTFVLPDGGDVAYADVALAALLSGDVKEARTFVRDELGALLGQGPRDTTVRLRETVEAYFAELASVTRTARRLGVHENTVQYRLQRAAEALGRPLRERSVELQVALVLARLLPPEDAQPRL